MVPRCPACAVRFKKSLVLKGCFRCPRCNKSISITRRKRSLAERLALATIVSERKQHQEATGNHAWTCAAPTKAGDIWLRHRAILSMLAPPRSDAELGRLVGYRILDVLGRGGMGVVFLGEDECLGRRVAIKAMLPDLGSCDHARLRFLREARAAASLECDHVVSILHVGEEGGVPFLVMPFLRGETLESKLQNPEPAKLELVLKVGEQVSRALAAAHAAGILHRDVKPANIWLESREDIDRDKPRHSKLRVKLLDFGLAFLAADRARRLTLLGDVLGTPGYMAPEQSAGHDVDFRADLFSLGCVLYRMATGRQAFVGNTAEEVYHANLKQEPIPVGKLNPVLPRGAARLIDKLLAREPDRRPTSALAVAERFRALRRRGEPQIVRGDAIGEALSLAR